MMDAAGQQCERFNEALDVRIFACVRMQEQAARNLGIFLREFRGHPVIYAWEVANEPEWSIREFAPAPAAKLPVAEFRAYAREMTRAIHEFAVAPATLG